MRICVCVYVINRRGVMELYRHELLTSAPDVGEWSASRPDRFNLWETAVDIQLIYRVGRKGGLGRSGDEENVCPCR
jgi:hypothetical protein